MSQHIFDTRYKARQVRVMMGFDRPLTSFFMNISYLDSPTQYPDDVAEDSNDDRYADESEEEGYVYDSLAGSGGTLNSYRAALKSLDIEVPESMFQEVQNDADTAIGNRVARYHRDGRFEEELLSTSSRAKAISTEAIASTSHEPAELIAIGPSDHFPSGYVRFEWYQSDEIAIELLDTTLERMGTATVALLHVGSPNPGPFGVWLKGWSENEGVPEVLVSAGLVTLSGTTFQIGFAIAHHAELTIVGRDMYIRSRLDSYNRNILLRVIDEMARSQKLTESQADHLRSELPGSTCTKLLRAGLSIAAIVEQQLKSQSRA